MTKFILFMNLDMVLIEIQLQKSSLAFDKVLKRVGIITIATEKCEFLFHATFSWLSADVVSFKNSLIFMQDGTDASVNTCCKFKLVTLRRQMIS